VENGIEKPQEGLEKIIESLANKGSFILSREEFKNLKRGIRILEETVNNNENIVQGILKWYNTWKEQISLPKNAINQLVELFKEYK